MLLLHARQVGHGVSVADGSSEGCREFLFCTGSAVGVAVGMGVVHRATLMVLLLCLDVVEPEVAAAANAVAVVVDGRVMPP